MWKDQHEFPRRDVGLGFCIVNKPPGEADAAWAASPVWAGSLETIPA